MSATTTEPATGARKLSRISFSGLIAVEARKTFDTRAGAWLLAALGILAALGSAGVVLWAPEDDLTYDLFTAAIEIPMSVLLPVIAILAVTSEYSQRTALATFALVPQRGRVLGAKYVVVLVTAVVSLATALLLGAVGNVVGGWTHGVAPVWDVGAGQMGLILISQTIGMSMGFMFGVLLRSSPAAIVGYFVYSLVMPVVFGGLAGLQDWFEELQPWVDLGLTSTRLTDVGPSAEQWAQLGTASALWLFVPLAIGIRSALRAEIK